MRNKSYISAIIAGLGMLSLISGLIWLKLVPDAAASVFPYLCIGLGCGVFGHGAGELISRRVTGKHPEIQKQMEIDKNDVEISEEDGYFWCDYATLNTLVQVNNTLNIQLRNVLSLLEV
jgi:hypothetical protein